MPRPYTVTSENVSIAAAQDLAQIIGAAGKILQIVQCTVGFTDTSLPTAQMLRLQCNYLPATVTNGSGGTSPTPAPLDPGDAAASFTAKANSTTPATTNATAVQLIAVGVHIYAGWDWPFKDPIVIGPSESFTFKLLSTVSGTCHASMTVKIIEMGG